MYFKLIAFLESLAYLISTTAFFRIKLTIRTIASHTAMFPDESATHTNIGPDNSIMCVIATGAATTDRGDVMALLVCKTFNIVFIKRQAIPSRR